MSPIRLALLLTCVLDLAATARAEPEPSAPLAAFLEARVPDELAAEGLVLSRRNLALQIEPVGDKLLVSLIDLVTGRVVASTKLDNPPRDREAAVASVTQVAAALVTQYSGTPAPSQTTAIGPTDPLASTTQPSTPLPPRSSATSARDGVTFELNVGLGFQHLSTTNTDLSASLAIGFGTWIIPQRVALTARIGVVGVNAPGTHLGSLVYSAFLGPSLQYWIDDHLWLGGGVGFTTFRTSSGSSLLDVRSPCLFGAKTCDVNGVGIDLRAGYSIGPTKHQLNVSVEVVPGSYGTDPALALYGNAGRGGAATSFALMLGYQYL